MMPTMNRKEGDLYRVVLPYFVAGVIVRMGVVVEAAPILRWAVGKSLADLETWVRKKRGNLCSIALQVSKKSSDNREAK
jgi:hypothetical protein